MITREMYQEIDSNQKRLNTIIKKYSDGKHHVNDVVQQAWERGDSLKRTIRLDLWQSRFTLQQSARAMYRLLNGNDIFTSTYDLASPDDIPELLGFHASNALATVEQQVERYFQSYERIDYNPRSFYFYHLSSTGWVNFCPITMRRLVDCYTKMISFILEQPTSKVVISVLTEPAHADTAHTGNRLDSDIYVLELILQHHKSHIYDLNDRQMEKVYHLGQRLQFLQDSANRPGLNSQNILDDLAQGMRDLADQRIISPATVSTLVSPSYLKSQGIRCDIDARYVHYQGYVHPLNVPLLSQLYQKVLKEVFHPHRLD